MSDRSDWRHCDQCGMDYAPSFRHACGPGAAAAREEYLRERRARGGETAAEREGFGAYLIRCTENPAPRTLVLYGECDLCHESHPEAHLRYLPPHDTPVCPPCRAWLQSHREELRYLNG